MYYGMYYMPFWPWMPGGYYPNWSYWMGMFY